MHVSVCVLLDCINVETLKTAFKHFKLPNEIGNKSKHFHTFFLTTELINDLGKRQLIDQ